MTPTTAALDLDPFAEFPVIDLALWRSGDPDQRRRVQEQTDYALRSSGFLLIINHGIDETLAHHLKVTSREFFALPTDVKSHYRTQPGGAGWIPPGAESNGHTSGLPTPADLKEGLSFGPVGDNASTVTGQGLVPIHNIYPCESRDIEQTVRTYITQCLDLSKQLFSLFAAALDLPATTFIDQCTNPLHTLVVTWYPSLSDIDTPVAGQYRIGPHADFGTVTILDREPTNPGLQVKLTDGQWVDAPHVAHSLTINAGDLLSRWTSGRWKSNMHRVPAPSPDHPDDDRLSIVLFIEADPDSTIVPLPPTDGTTAADPINTVDFIHDKFKKLTLTPNPTPARGGVPAS